MHEPRRQVYNDFGRRLGIQKDRPMLRDIEGAIDKLPENPWGMSKEDVRQEFRDRLGCRPFV